MSDILTSVRDPDATLKLYVGNPVVTDNAVDDKTARLPSRVPSLQFPSAQLNGVPGSLRVGSVTFHSWFDRCEFCVEDTSAKLF